MSAINYEKAFIGSVLTFGGADIDLDPKDFSNAAYREVWEYIRNQRNLDMVDIEHRFNSEMLQDAVASTPSGTSLIDHATLIT